MKKITFLIVLIFISTLIPQQTGEIKPSVKNFYTELNNIVVHYDKKLGMQKKFSNEEVFDAAKSLYTATEDDPVGFRKQMETEYNSWVTEMKNNNKFIGLKPGVKMHVLIDLINEKYGKNFANILKIPYYLRVKILDIKKVVYVLKQDNNTFPQIDLICSVEDVIKGEKKFRKADVITISFLMHWFPEGAPLFLKDESYFIPVDYWKIDSEIEAFGIDIIHGDESSAVLLLKENQLIDPKNCYSLDSTKTWEVFKRNFLKKYRLN